MKFNSPGLRGVRSESASRRADKGAGKRPGARRKEGNCDRKLYFLSFLAFSTGKPRAAVGGATIFAEVRSAAAVAGGNNAVRPSEVAAAASARRSVAGDGTGTSAPSASFRNVRLMSPLCQSIEITSPNE